MVAAMILASFEFRLAPGKENQTRVVDDLKDGFTATPGELSVVFTPIDNRACRDGTRVQNGPR